MILVNQPTGQMPSCGKAPGSFSPAALSLLPCPAKLQLSDELIECSVFREFLYHIFSLHLPCPAKFQLSDDLIDIVGKSDFDSRILVFGEYFS